MSWQVIWLTRLFADKGVGVVNKDKIRLRTDEELAFQNKGLQEIKHVFEKLEMPFFLSSGTLLGAVRERNFIRWDWDVQCYLMTEEAYEKRNEILQAFILAGFQVLKYDSSYKNFKYNILKYDTNYEITSWWKKGEMRYRSNFSRIPARFFENPRTIEFLGEIYPCMTPPEEYLEYCYGDWKTPKREDDKNKYLNPQFYTCPAWYRKSFGLIYKLSRRLFRKANKSINIGEYNEHN